jgi:phage terminase large subunit-like protein
MIDEIDIAKKTLDGLLDGQRVFALLYEPDNELMQGEIWMKDDRCIYQSNPVAVTHEYIFEELKKKRAIAVLYENKRENYLCKHNNIRYKSLGVEGYIDVQKVKQCRREAADAWWNGKRVWIGLDLSQSDDNTAVAMVTAQEDVIYAKVVGFLPAGRMEYKRMKEKVDYPRLVKDGECIACGDEVIDYMIVEEYIMGLEDRYGVEIQQVGYDRWNAISTVQKLEEAGITCVEIKQHSSVLHMPTKFLKEEILSRNFQYDKSQLLEINFQNARCTEDTNLNKYVNKKKSAGKVDMVVALINAIYLLQQDMLFGDGGFTVQVC